jgi:hypothetical protein
VERVINFLNEFEVLQVVQEEIVERHHDVPLFLFRGLPAILPQSKAVAGAKKNRQTGKKGQTGLFL